MSSPEPVLSQYLHSKGARLGIPVAGTFELTPRCNFNCKMCYVHLTAEECMKRGRELTADEWLEIARIARDRGVVFLLLTGGEPLIRSDFKYLYTELSKMGFLISINTNGSLIDDDYFELFKKYPPMRFNISLYGTSDDTYESLCGNRSFTKVINNIRRLKDAGIAVKLNVLFGPSNVEDMEAIRRISEDLDVPFKPTTYLYPPIRVDGDETGENKARFSPEKAAYYSMQCDKLRFAHDIFVKRTAAVCRGIRHVSEEDCEGVPSEGSSCRAGRSSFWMTWDGRMLPCGMMSEPESYPLRDGFDKAWEDTKAGTLRIRMPRECVSCSYRHACHVCAAATLAETGRFDGKPQYICDMVGEFVRLYKEEYAAFEKNGDLDKYAKEDGNENKV
ncbi:MAG: radical SAM protein [Clostridia bacterium]|nr:radical SAM protein [Clostridia bacterium]